jgi:two-component system, chemotaxis family, response regulator Rcp1
MSAGEVERTSADILLVEDNPVDVLVTKTALEESGFDFELHVAEDGEEALDFLYQNCNSTDSNKPCPDLILLDINLPRKNGKEVLAEIKQHPETLHIPVVILTTSNDEKDIHESYSLHANCYVTKPVDVENFTKAVQCIGKIWMEVAKLPSKN